MKNIILFAAVVASTIGRISFIDEVKANSAQKPSENPEVYDEAVEINRFVNAATPTWTPTISPTFTPTPTITDTPSPTQTLTPDPDYIPPLAEFVTMVREEGLLGLWAEGYFAYEAYFASWGHVPNTYNTASNSSSQGFSGFFIHNYLGGDKLYRVPKWTKVALIWPDRIEWYQIDGIIRYRGTPNGQTCGYKAPYVEWGQEIKKKGISAIEIASRHFQKPLAIQTSICQGDAVGVHILTGTWTTN